MRFIFSVRAFSIAYTAQKTVRVKAAFSLYEHGGNEGEHSSGDCNCLEYDLSYVYLFFLLADAYFRKFI